MQIYGMMFIFSEQVFQWRKATSHDDMAEEILKSKIGPDAKTLGDSYSETI